MTGTPIVFPTDVGTDATKIFVGDADGTIWSFDVSNSEPDELDGRLFLDLYNTTVDPNDDHELVRRPAGPGHADRCPSTRRARW